MSSERESHVRDGARDYISTKDQMCARHWFGEANLSQHVPAVCVCVERQVFAQDFDGVVFEDGRGVDGAFDGWHGLSEDAVHKDHALLWGGPWNTHNHTWAFHADFEPILSGGRLYRAARVSPSASVLSERRSLTAPWSVLRRYTAPSSQTPPESGRDWPPLSLRTHWRFNMMSVWSALGGCSVKRGGDEDYWIWSVRSAPPEDWEPGDTRCPPPSSWPSSQSSSQASETRAWGDTPVFEGMTRIWYVCVSVCACVYRVFRGMEKGKLWKTACLKSGLLLWIIRCRLTDWAPALSPNRVTWMHTDTHLWPLLSHEVLRHQKSDT